MHSSVLALALFFFTVANISTFYLYTYPVFHGCAFPTPPAHPPKPIQSAPFRLLVFGDPQLEGDSSLPNPDDSYFPSLQRAWSEGRSGPIAERPTAIWRNIGALVYDDILRFLQTLRKRLDLLGNDFYLAHIYRSLQSSTNPTHIAVLGDLLGSQWVSDEEFERRGSRYWDRVFHGGQRVEDDITDGISIAPLGLDERWKSRIINVAGNHDIGYSGDITRERLARFERVFGAANWETRLQLRNLSSTIPPDDEEVVPELRLLILNSLNMDTPALDTDLQLDTYNFINAIISASPPVSEKSSSTILLTHLPLHKPAGLCVDGPHFAYHQPEHGGGVKEQNHLSQHASISSILEGIYGMNMIPDGAGNGLGRNGIILTGHDHEGCDVYHHLPNAGSVREWEAENTGNVTRLMGHKSVPGIREITVRSMMGEFGGNAGLLSAWFDPGAGKWVFEYMACALGKQHFWWAVHAFDIVAFVFIVGVVGWEVFGIVMKGRSTGVAGKEKTS